MTRFVVAMGLVVGALWASLWSVTHAQSYPEATVVASLERLADKTGWVPLGLITADRKEWAVAADPAEPFLTGTYRILERIVDRRLPALPNVGERIQLVTSVPILIRDFATLGNARRLDRPPEGGVDFVRDGTGLRLAAGTVVKVCDIVVTEPIGEIRSVLARVCPEN